MISTLTGFKRLRISFTALIRERLISCSVKPEQGCDMNTFINKTPFFYGYLIQVIKFLTS